MVFIYDELAQCNTNVGLKGKVAVVTGSTSGMGLETAKNLAKRGAKVIIASRNLNKLAQAKNEIIKASGHDRVVTRQMDFESLASIRNFTRTTIATEPRVDILINNIGAIGLEDTRTIDGLNKMMQVNFFGTFLLTFLLFPLLKASAPSRIVHVSSVAAFGGQIDLESINDIGKHSTFKYYSDAKLADILFSLELDRRTKGSGVSTYSMDPGLIKTEFFRHLNDTMMREFLNKVLYVIGRPDYRIAAMPVYLAASPEVEGKSGYHFYNCLEFFTSWFAKDKDLMRKLWEVSKKLVGVTEEEDWELNYMN